MKSILKSKYMRLIRPIAWITFLLPFCAGFGIGVTSKSDIYHVIFAFLSFICWMIFCFTVNAMADKDVDKFHDGKSKDIDIARQPLVTGEFTEKEATYISIVSLISSFIFAWLVNIFFFVMIIMVMIIGYIYSMPPMRLKSKPVGDIFCNSFAGGIIFIAGLKIGGFDIEPIIILASIIIISITASVLYIPSVITDYKFDKKAGLKTSAVFFGPKKILRAMYPLTAMIVIIWIIVFFVFDLFLLKVSSLFFIVCSIAITIISNAKFKNDRLYISTNLVIYPFLAMSIVFIVYGILKIIDIV